VLDDVVDWESANGTGILPGPQYPGTYQAASDVPRLAVDDRRDPFLR